MSEPTMVTRSVTISEVIGEQGTYLVTTTEGDPATWDIIGMLRYSLRQHEMQVFAFEDCEYDE